MRGRLFVALIALAFGGCMARPLSSSPFLLRGDPQDTSNQILVTPAQPGPQAYANVFETVLDVIDDTFDIAYSNRYDGRIETHPRVAPGLGQLFKSGSPNFFERALATSQSYRHRGFVLIAPDRDGYLINVTILKELEDVPQPTRETAGGAAFRSDATVDRTFEVSDPVIQSVAWIPKGRDYPMEQRILQKIRQQLR